MHVIGAKMTTAATTSLGVVLCSLSCYNVGIASSQSGACSITRPYLCGPTDRLRLLNTYATRTVCYHLGIALAEWSYCSITRPTGLGGLLVEPPLQEEVVRAAGLVQRQTHLQRALPPLQQL